MNPDLQGSQNGLSAATRPFEICLFGPTCGGGVCLIKRHYFLALFAYWFHFHDYSEETYPRNDHTWTHGVLCQSERVVSMAIAIKNNLTSIFLAFLACRCPDEFKFARFRKQPLRFNAPLSNLPFLVNLRLRGLWKGKY